MCRLLKLGKLGEPTNIPLIFPDFAESLGVSGNLCPRNRTPGGVFLHTPGGCPLYSSVVGSLHVDRVPTPIRRT